jgi:hypothetical protein
MGEVPLYCASPEKCMLKSAGGENVATGVLRILINIGRARCKCSDAPVLN